MAKDNEFREPVFVRDDDTTTIKASVVVWKDDRLSVRLQGSNESVLVNAEDWAVLVACVNRELDRCS
jgi:hypothetical protein